MKLIQRYIITIPTTIVLLWIIVSMLTDRGKPDLKSIDIRRYFTMIPLFTQVLYRNKFEALFRDVPCSYSVPDVLYPYDYIQLGDDRKVNGTVAERFLAGVNRYELYSHNDTELIEELLEYMASATIEYAREKSGGTQVKMVLYLGDDEAATIVKPWRVPREYETLPDHYYWADVERHNAEISFFHLDRILDFRRVPPSTGRILNLTDIKLRSGEDLQNKFFLSPEGNVCFMTECDQYCDNVTSPVCGNPDMIEASVTIYLTPSIDIWDMDNPYERTYDPVEKKQWEIDQYYCKRVLLEDEFFAKGRLMLDVIDQSILDYLSGNLDRHSYMVYPDFNNKSSIMHIDNGRSFGKYKTDDISCMAALIQCCMVRRTTYERLLILQTDDYKLGDVLRDSMAGDRIAPVLYEPHYEAVNRRLDVVISEITKCIDKAASREDVLKEEPIFVLDDEDRTRTRTEDDNGEGSPRESLDERRSGDDGEEDVNKNHERSAHEEVQEKEDTEGKGDVEEDENNEDHGMNQRDVDNENQLENGEETEHEDAEHHDEKSREETQHVNSAV